VERKRRNSTNPSLLPGCGGDQHTNNVDRLAACPATKQPHHATSLSVESLSRQPWLWGVSGLLAAASGQRPKSNPKYLTVRHALWSRNAPHSSILSTFRMRSLLRPVGVLSFMRVCLSGEFMVFKLDVSGSERTARFRIVFRVIRLSGDPFIVVTLSFLVSVFAGGAHYSLCVHCYSHMSFLEARSKHES